MNLESIMLNKRSQTQKTTFHMILFTWNFRNKTLPTENKSLAARSQGWQRELAKEELKGTRGLMEISCILILTVFAWVYTFIKLYPMFYFKGMSFIVCKLYLQLVWCQNKSSIKNRPQSLFLLLSKSICYWLLSQQGYYSSSVLSYSNMVLVAKLHLTLASPYTVAHQALLSMAFPRQEYWSGLPFPSPGIKLVSLVSPALQADSLPSREAPIKQQLPFNSPCRFKEYYSSLHFFSSQVVYHPSQGRAFLRLKFKAICCRIHSCSGETRLHRWH